ncbi:hypothetical protein CsatA_028465 [Cannabis sativa]
MLWIILQRRRSFLIIIMVVIKQRSIPRKEAWHGLWKSTRGSCWNLFYQDLRSTHKWEEKIFYKRGEKFDEKTSNYTRSTYFDDVLKINHLERPIYMNNEYKYDHDDDHKHHHSSPTSHKHHHSSPTSELELKLGAPNTSNTITKTSPQNLLFY